MGNHLKALAYDVLNQVTSITEFYSQLTPANEDYLTDQQVAQLIIDIVRQIYKPLIVGPTE